MAAKKQPAKPPTTAAAKPAPPKFDHDVAPWESGTRELVRMVRPVRVGNTADKTDRSTRPLDLQPGDVCQVAKDRADRWVKYGKAAPHG